MLRALPSADVRRSHLIAAQMHEGLAAMRCVHTWQASLPVSEASELPLNRVGGRRMRGGWEAGKEYRLAE